jgi:spermidine synthase
MNFRKSFYSGIFLVAASTLLLEITLTKIFSVIHFHYFAFFIVSTALFGYGFSGIYLSTSKRLEKISKSKLLFISAFLFALSTVLSYKLILLTPLRIGELLSSSAQLRYLAQVYLLLALPFFFSGLVIGLLLSYCTDRINRLYFADLTGAAIGCFAIVFLIPVFGGSGTVLVAAILACISAIVLAERRVWAVWPLLLLIFILFLLPKSEKFFPTAEKSEKRYFRDSLEKEKLLYTGWSPASRIDVVTQGKDRSVIWIDGGTNQSFMMRLNQRIQQEKPPRKSVWKTFEIPYALIQNPKAMIIGPGGGIEVASALQYHPASITAVELDPLITKIVLGMFSDYIGHIYTRPNVMLVNEEGRSFIRRSNQKYDIIQQKNNSHPMAVATGALNLTETYLLTKEAFDEYLDHLKPGGFLTIERHGGIRLLTLATEVLKERGVKDYWKQLVLIRQNALNQTFLMKNGPFTDSELDFIQNYCAEKRETLLYTPRIRETVKNVFTALMHDELRDQLIRGAPFHLEPPTDDWPFMEHFFRLKSLFSPQMRKDLNHKFWYEAGISDLSRSVDAYPDLSLYLILLEALILSTVFILYPLFKMKRSGIAVKGAVNLLLYFFCLGVGFIFIEIAFIQKYILFIGYPVYAVAAIIFSLLIGAGLGSLYSGRFIANPFKALKIVVMAIFISTLLQTLLVPMLFRYFLSVPFPMRIALSVLFIFPAGFFMGMPFPLGLSWTSKSFPSFVPWAWGINGYATVIGSVLSVILALHFGFRTVLWIATATYVVAYLCLQRTSVYTTSSVISERSQLSALERS